MERGILTQMMTFTHKILSIIFMFHLPVPLLFNMQQPPLHSTLKQIQPACNLRIHSGSSSNPCLGPGFHQVLFIGQTYTTEEIKYVKFVGHK